MRTAAPALAAFLITGAGVAGIAQPIGAYPAPAARPMQAATIRIVLPPPTAMAPAPRPRPATTSGFSQQRLAPVAPAQDAAALVPAEPAAAPAAIARHSTPSLRDKSTDLAASRGLSDAEYSAPPRTLAAPPAPKPIPMVDAASRAALARLDGSYAASGTSRMDALQPVRPSTQALIDMAPQRAARPSAAPIRMQPDEDETIGRYRRTSQGLAFEVATSLNGEAVGQVSLLIRDGENISVRLADLLAAVKSAIDPTLYDKLSSSQAAQSYMTFNELREAGLAVRFNDKDRLILGTR